MKRTDRELEKSASGECKRVQKMKQSLESDSESKVHVENVCLPVFSLESELKSKLSHMNETSWK